MFQSHFDNAQYESHREDGLHKLRPDAVPMVFDLSPQKMVKQQQCGKQGID